MTATSSTPGVRTIGLNETVSGTLSTADDVRNGSFFDVFIFEGTSGQGITIDLTSVVFDAFLLIEAPSGQIFSHDDVSSENRNSRLELTLEESGSFSITATSALTEQTGAYEISVTGLGATTPPEPTPGDALDVTASASITEGPAPLAVDFQAIFQGGVSPISSRWEFGDGQSSTEQNPSHTYTEAGTFTASVTVTDAEGGAAQSSVLISVTSAASPARLEIDSIEPGLGIPGSEALDLTFFGIGFEETPEVVFRGGGIILNSVLFEDSTRLTVNISITSTAQPGARTVELTNPSGSAATGSFEVSAETIGTAQIEIDSIEPSHVEPGQEIDLLVFGVGFQEGVTVLVRVTCPRKLYHLLRESS